MIDTWGREINYLRISLTDRCNMRCQYCMPDDVPSVGHDEILRYEEILLICRAALQVGIHRFKITGGEPLARKGAISFMQSLRQLPGVQSMTLTTNGLLLQTHIAALKQMGADAVNISLDSLHADQFRQISGVDGLSCVLQTLVQTVQAGIRTKVNAVLLQQTRNQLLPLARLAETMPVAVRFIEMMPIGYGTQQQGWSADDALAVLQSAYPDLQVDARRHGNGPAVYYTSQKLQGCLGMIAANTHKFCRQCNRMRLTSTGFLKPCLCYDDGVDLKAIVRSGHTDVLAALRQAIGRAAAQKPVGHCFDTAGQITENKTMNQIGG